MIGSDGAFTLLLSNLLMAATAGLSLLWQVRTVRQTARNAPAALPPAMPLDLLMVLGTRLSGDRITAEYAQRLMRAVLLQNSGESRTVLVVGGRTGRATVSEADQGRRFLIGAGIPAERILIEDRSAHTLENLRFARALLQQRSRQPFALITSRYHLARSAALARGLDLCPVLCAAEDRWQDGIGSTLRLCWEAYLLHWYTVGGAWSRWTGNRRSLAKIT